MRIIPKDIPSGSVLGINYNGLHDSAIVIVAPDGTPVFGMALERLSRHKQDGRPPYVLLDQIPWDRISRVGLSNRLANDQDYQTTSRLFDVVLKESVPRREFRHPIAYQEFIEQIPCETVEVCHHLAHTASSFWASGFDRALCLSYDAGIYSSPWFGGLYMADRGDGIIPVDMFSRFYHPEVASLYSFVTALLGFIPNRHEGKITGLAAYGKPTDACRELIEQWYVGNTAITGQATSWVFSNDSERSPIGFADDARMEPFRRSAARFSREELAATLQEFCERHVVNLLSRAREEGWWREKICLAGGLFANVKINQRVVEMGFDSIFVAPPMTDDGTALGAAWHILSTEPGFSPSLDSVYLGPSFPGEEVEARLVDDGVQFELLPEPARCLAELLAGGSVVAIFQGAMELGPRALGNRSILAEAVNPDINQSLNGRLNRTEFMPFAPVSRMEDADDCYLKIDRVARAAEFMTVTVDCTDAMRNLCPAVAHVDGTARPQLVSAASNPLVHAILTHYKAITGRPALVNTSFNIHEEPIVCTLQDALKGFFESGIDYLFVGDSYLVSFEKNKDLAMRYLRQRLAQPSQRADTLREILRWKSINALQRETLLQERIDSLLEDVHALENQISELRAHVGLFEKSRSGRLIIRLIYMLRRVRAVLSRLAGAK